MTNNNNNNDDNKKHDGLRSCPIAMKIAGLSKMNIEKQTIKISEQLNIYFRIWLLQREEVNKVLVHFWPENKLSFDMA